MRDDSIARESVREDLSAWIPIVRYLFYKFLIVLGDHLLSLLLSKESQTNKISRPTTQAGDATAVEPPP